MHNPTNCDKMIILVFYSRFSVHVVLHVQKSLNVQITIFEKYFISGQLLFDPPPYTVKLN